MSETTRTERTDYLKNNRGSRYGRDPEPGFRSLGRLWRGLIEDWFQVELPDDIPPHVVSLMCVALKLSRAARPWEKPDTDDYDDAHVYLELSQSMNPTFALDVVPGVCVPGVPSTWLDPKDVDVKECLDDVYRREIERKPTYAEKDAKIRRGLAGADAEAERYWGQDVFKSDGGCCITAWTCDGCRIRNDGSEKPSICDACGSVRFTPYVELKKEGGEDV